LAADFFAAGFFALDFVAILLFFYGLTHLRNFSFPEGDGIMLLGATIVNGGHASFFVAGSGAGVAAALNSVLFPAFSAQ
jgi:hypothetical protein